MTKKLYSGDVVIRMVVYAESYEAAREIMRRRFREESDPAKIVVSEILHAWDVPEGWMGALPYRDNKDTDETTVRELLGTEKSAPCWRIPDMHSTHRERCGCALGGAPRAEVLICSCGAGYLRSEIAAFPVFLCYDCAQPIVFGTMGRAKK